MPQIALKKLHTLDKVAADWCIIGEDKVPDHFVYKNPIPDQCDAVGLAFKYVVEIFYHHHFLLIQNTSQEQSFCIRKRLIGRNRLYSCIIEVIFHGGHITRGNIDHRPVNCKRIRRLVGQSTTHAIKNIIDVSGTGVDIR